MVALRSGCKTSWETREESGGLRHGLHQHGGAGDPSTAPKRHRAPLWGPYLRGDLRRANCDSTSSIHEPLAPQAGVSGRIDARCGEAVQDPVVHFGRHVGESPHHIT